MIHLWPVSHDEVVASRLRITSSILTESTQGVSAPDGIAAAAESSLIDKPFENHDRTTTPATHSFVLIPEEKPYIPEVPSDRSNSDSSREYNPQLPVSILPSADGDQSTTRQGISARPTLTSHPAR